MSKRGCNFLALLDLQSASQRVGANERRILQIDNAWNYILCIMQVDNAYNEFEGKVVADLGCGTVSVQLS